jgi:hypothetical protein
LLKLIQYNYKRWILNGERARPSVRRKKRKSMIVLLLVTLRSAKRKKIRIKTGKEIERVQRSTRRKIRRKSITKNEARVSSDLEIGKRRGSQRNGKLKNQNTESTNDMSRVDRKRGTKRRRTRIGVHDLDRKTKSTVCSSPERRTRAGTSEMTRMISTIVGEESETEMRIWFLMPDGSGSTVPPKVATRVKNQTTPTM